MASAEKRLRDELGADQWVLTDADAGGFGARFADNAFGFIPARGRLYVVPFSSVKHVGIRRTWASTSKTTGGLSVTGALVGGALLGPAGMLLGGTTGKRTTQGKEYLTNLWLQIDLFGPNGGGAMNFSILKNGGSMFSETLLVRSEQYAAHAHALVSQVIRLGMEVPPQSAAPAPQIPEPVSKVALADAFEGRVQHALTQLGWRVQRHDEGCLVGLRGEKRGVFIHDRLGGSAGSVQAAYQKHRQFVEATSRSLVVANLFVDGKREAERLGYKVMEIQALEDKARRAPPAQAVIASIDGAFNF